MRFNAETRTKHAPTNGGIAGWKAALRRDGEQEIRLGEQAAQFGDDGLIARGEWRNHHVELVDAGRDQAGERDDGVEPADAYAEFLGTGEGSRGRHQGRG